MAIAPPLTLTLLRVEPELAHDGQRLRGERLVELDEVDVVDAEAGALERRRDAGIGPRPIVAGSTPATADATEPGDRPQPELARPRRARHQHARRRRR